MKLHKSQQMRMERIEKVFNTVKEKQPISINGLLGSFPEMSRQIIQDYLRVLVATDKIKRNEVGKFVTTK